MTRLCFPLLTTDQFANMTTDQFANMRAVACYDGQFCSVDAAYSASRCNVSSRYSASDASPSQPSPSGLGSISLVSAKAK